MYRNCIFCSADLGSNECLEHFPVGARLAFDAWKGRLWALCPRCARWNLSPIEERWEAVEEAEKHFRDARLRVQSENVGLAKLADGTRLIRVGEALPGELAAWRYGDTLKKRRWRYVLGLTGGAAIGGLLSTGIGLMGVVGVASTGLVVPQVLIHHHMHRKARRPIYRLRAAESPTGEQVFVRRSNLHGAELRRGVTGELMLHLPFGVEPSKRVDESGRPVWSNGSELTLEGPAARRVLERAFVVTNESGGSERVVKGAVEELARAGGAESFLADRADRAEPLTIPPMFSTFAIAQQNIERMKSRLRGEEIPREVRDWYERAYGRRLQKELRVSPKEWRASRVPSLALEMALHEESERRALEGELAQLQAAWREAEEIAAIADSLGNDPLERLLPAEVAGE